MQEVYTVMPRPPRQVENFKCPECNKTFKYRYNVRNHRRIHTNERPFACECGERYRWRSSLDYHLKRTGHRAAQNPQLQDHRKRDSPKSGDEDDPDPGSSSKPKDTDQTNVHLEGEYEVCMF